MFDFLENLPLFVFIIAIFIVFVIFLFGGITLLRAGEDEQKIERSRRILLTALYSLFVVLLIAFTFFLVTYLLERGEVLLPPEVTGEIPSFPAFNFPPPPQSFKIGEYYFSEPRPLAQYNILKCSAIYVILCKTEEDYDIMYIGETGGKEQLLKHREYKCWSESCDDNPRNLYIAIFSAGDREKVKERLVEQALPPCPFSQ